MSSFSDGLLVVFSHTHTCKYTEYLDKQGRSIELCMGVNCLIINATLAIVATITKMVFINSQFTLKYGTQIKVIEVAQRTKIYYFHRYMEYLLFP